MTQETKTTTGKYTSEIRKSFNGTYLNRTGNRVFKSDDNWLVLKRWDGPYKTDFYYCGQLFENGELINDSYEISETRLNQWFPVRVGA